MDRVARALELADRLSAGEALAPPAPVAARRSVALGDPQATAARLFALLDHQQLLGDDGWLRPDVQLVSIGDHFDFGTRAQGTLPQAQADGPRFLRWLAAHPPGQVTILLGNHDAARVMELAFADDERFEAAAALATDLVALRDVDPAAYAERVAGEYATAYPELPGPGLVHRDFSAFTAGQRALVAELLLAGRIRLAATATRGGVPVLLTHAGITLRELELLGAVDEREPSALAAALDDHLRRAVDAVAPDWRAGRPAALSLAPLHVAGATGADDPELPEGGGLLYHRPADPDRPGADRSWELERTRPRRFHPVRLPRGLVQACGHTGHAKCVAELVRWRDPALVEGPAGLRTLRVDGDVVQYHLGASAPGADSAVLYMIDPTLHRAADVTAIDVLELDAGSIAAS
ncbi:MAG TPA: hypothetical protein VHE35_10020 [Kofleriaceae bacterium]|nr:hypothetical protein [Kofleriaceae bacterium]